MEGCVRWCLSAGIRRYPPVPIPRAQCPSIHPPNQLTKCCEYGLQLPPCPSLRLSNSLVLARRQRHPVYPSRTRACTLGLGLNKAGSPVSQQVHRYLRYQYRVCWKLAGDVVEERLGRGREEGLLTKPKVCFYSLKLV